MDHANEHLDAGYTLEELLEFAAATSAINDGSRDAANDDGVSRRESFTGEIDAWARHARAANGFGDY